MVGKTTKHWLGAVAIFALGIGVTASAEAGSATPISACPYTIEIPEGNYVVTGNLTSTGTCITIRGRNHALDLQGHTITGNGHGYGIVCLTDEVLCNTNVVANGTVTHFSAGVFLDGNYNTVAQITSQQNTGLDSIDGTGVGIQLIGDFGNVIADSLATENQGTGILGQPNSFATTVTNSQSNGNGFHGIAAVGRVNNSTANTNQGCGIYNAIIVTGATTKGNVGCGITLIPGNPSNGASVSDSTAAGNGGDGIQSGGGNVINSTANNNGGRGIVLTCPASAYGNSAISNPGGNLVTSDNTCVLLDNKTVGKSNALP
jgi:hypothetical protein